MSLAMLLAVRPIFLERPLGGLDKICLLYTSDAADERSSVDLGGRRIIKKKKRRKQQALLSDNAKYVYIRAMLTI